MQIRIPVFCSRFNIPLKSKNLICQHDLMKKIIKTEILTFVNKEKESEPEKEVELKTPTQVSDSLVNFIKYEEYVKMRLFV